MKAILEFLQRLGPQRLAAMGVVTLTLIGFFAFLMLRMGSTPMSVLYADLSMTDSNAIIRELDTRGITYELRQEGSVILVPRETATRLRMDFAAKGMPIGGSVGYEIFDKTDTFSATSFVQGVNQLRAMEGELARTIKGIDRVQSARVHLAIPEKKLFDREKTTPRASIILKLRGELDAGQIRAIRHLVASAVQGMKPENISIVDEGGRLLADGAGNENEPAVLAQDRQSAYEKKLRGQVEDLVASIVGRGKARVQVAAEMDFNRIQQVSDAFDPESRVVRSTQTRTENQQSSEARDGQVTVANEMPQTTQQGQGNARDTPQSREQSQKAEETVNYEISKTTRTEVLEAGRVKRLSVAVLVDGLYAPGANGQMAYRPRAAEEIEQITALVRSSIGFDRARGDQVQVINLRFAETQATLDAQTPSLLQQMMALTREDALRLLEIGVFAILTLLVLLLVIRPLLHQMGILGKTPKEDKNEESGKNSPAALPAPTGLHKVLLQAGAMQNMPAIAGAGDASAAAIIAANSNQDVSAGIQQALHQSAIDSLGKIVEENPGESTAIIRQWISQGR